MKMARVMLGQHAIMSVMNLGTAMTGELEYFSKKVAKGLMGRREFMKRAAALGVGAIAANGMVATAAKAQGPLRGGNIKAGYSGGESTNSLDPATMLSNAPIGFSFLFGETLVRESPDNKIDFRIAESVEPSPDAKKWVFRIRKGMEFHNGKSITPEDVAETINRHRDKDTKSGAIGILGGIEDILVDGQNVVFKLSSGNADFPFVMADFHLPIQPGGGRENPADGVSAGPYRVIENQPGVRYAGERFENYFDLKNRAFADTAEILVLNDNTARIAALQAGTVDVINQIPPKIVKLLNGKDGVTVRNASGGGHYPFVMRTNIAPFDNYDLRMALKFAINREEMVEKILRGFGSVGNDFPINASYPLFSDDIEQRVYDPEKAAFHYKKSGVDSPIVLHISDVTFPGAVDAAQLFQESANAAGIPLQIKREPGDGYWSEIWNRKPFCGSYWAGQPTQDEQYSIAYLSSAEWNETKFENPAFDKLILAARSELDTPKRKSMYREAAMIVRDEGGVILPMFNDFVDATGPRIQGWINDPNAEMMNHQVLTKCWLDS